MSGNVISIRNNFPKVAAQLDRLGADVGNKAMVRALNKTVDQGKTEMARVISREFNLSVGKAKDRLAVKRASAKGGALRFEAVLEATKRGKGRSMNLIAFVESKVTPTEGRRRAKDGTQSQLRFQIKRAGGKKMIKGAFIGNDGRTVFIREGKARLPIKALNTIDVPQMFNTKKLNALVREVMLKRFDANFKRELRSVLQGYIR
ncbi:MAG: phage tail protein [Rhodocyclales bacterium]|nr:phage tail protein [Rhodocyclales bacterium]